MTEHYSWTRLLWYYTGYYDDYPTDIPKETDVNKKAVLCKQIGLSKLKMNKVIIDPSIPFDLQKIPETKPLKKVEYKPPPSSPEYVEIKKSPKSLINSILLKSAFFSEPEEDIELDDINKIKHV